MNTSETSRAHWQHRYGVLQAAAQWSAVEGDEDARLRLEAELELIWNVLQSSDSRGEVA